MKKPVFLVSDATGDTAEKVLRACLVQFDLGDHAVDMIRAPRTRTLEQVQRLIEEASKVRGLVVFTFVQKNLREGFVTLAKGRPILYADLMGSMLSTLRDYLHEEPEQKAGLLYRMDNHYFDRINAIEFTIAHDDGAGVESLDETDAVLVGPSRTSKTPLSMYLACLGMKTANVPYVPEVPLSEKLLTLDPKKVFALTIAVEILIERRKARVMARAYTLPREYVDPERVTLEVSEFEEICRRHRRWRMLDVTHKSIEELAFEIRSALGMVRSVRV